VGSKEGGRSRHEKTIRLVSARLANRKEIGATKKRRIDYSDIPALSDKQLPSMRRVGRLPLGEEPRQLIAIRLDVRVLRRVRSLAAKRRIPYQSLMNELLAGEMRKTG
jgi:uncharacterized protein (DUF4415 family)